MTNAKLEISVAASDGQAISLIAGDDLSDEPQHELRPLGKFRNAAEVMTRHERFVIDNDGLLPMCHARLGTVLPGETVRPMDFLAIVPSASGRLQLSIRVLAAELATPICAEHHLEVTGSQVNLALDELEELLLNETWRQRTKD